MLKILIANRGEIAIRIAKTCKRLGILPYGIFSEADKESLHIKYCEDAINIGGFLAIENYLCIDRIIDAAKKLGCEMIHPGYGFLSENENFVRSCRKEGLVFIGPSFESMKLSGDKVKTREIASRVSKIVDGKEVKNEDDALREGERIEYPVIIKAVEGGGGRGLRIARSQDELLNLFQESKNEAQISFGSNRIYLEKYLENPRHIEVQILSDKSNVIHLGERECSIQRRYQKLIEETPAPNLSTETRHNMTETAIKIIKEIGYENAGTVEFLFKNNKFYFMELNARIQVEHPITEEVTGVDIVEQQINIAKGDGLGLNQKEIKTRGNAIECRINAENPLTFSPYPGKIDYYKPPKEEGIRIETSLFEGYSIPVFYDSLIAKLISFGCNRNTAIDRMRKALANFRISGIPSTIPFHISAMNDQRFLTCKYDTSFVENMKYFSSRDGEIAAAIFAALPRKINFLEDISEEDPWYRKTVNIERLNGYNDYWRWSI
ncbi:MAG: acetyl/propionyl/methylcrotonyl-CoA carboxylase subunit alpha [Nitrososphaeraceae archaeon]